MNIQKIASGIGTVAKSGSSKIAQNIASNSSPKLKDVASKIIKAYEPTDYDNSFFGLATLMVGTVIIPRVLTASKRNPDNKEATMDEIKEILFRDLQTVAIMLFGLKSLNSVISALASKATGLPMTNKPYEKLFNSEGGIKDKALEVIKHPIQKAGTLIKNVASTLNPLGGVKAYTKNQYLSKYSNFSSLDEIQKMFTGISNYGGTDKNKKGADKVFNKVVKILTQNQEKLIKQQEKLANAGINKSGSQEVAQEILEKLQSLQGKGLEGLKEIANEAAENNEASKKIATQIVDFFKDGKNPVLNDALKIDGGLKTAALGIEVAYLGFGLPALNQKRLEKKYLKNEPTFQGNDVFCSKSNPLVDKSIKAQEIKLFHDFLK